MSRPRKPEPDLSVSGDAVRALAGWLTSKPEGATPVPTYAEIKAQRDALDEQLRAMEAEAAEAAIAEVKRLVAEFHLRPDQVFDAAALKRPRPDRGVTRPPKYRNPDNPAETWGGKGGVPKWYSAQLAAGRKAADMLIHKPDA